MTLTAESHLAGWRVQAQRSANRWQQPRYLVRFQDTLSPIGQYRIWTEPNQHPGAWEVVETFLPDPAKAPRATWELVASAVFTDERFARRFKLDYGGRGSLSVRIHVRRVKADHVVQTVYVVTVRRKPKGAK